MSWGGGWEEGRGGREEGRERGGERGEKRKMGGIFDGEI